MRRVCADSSQSIAENPRATGDSQPFYVESPDSKICLGRAKISVCDNGRPFVVLFETACIPRRACAQKANLLRGKLRAAFPPPTRKHSSAVFAPRSFQKTVCPCTLPLFRLVCSLHSSTISLNSLPINSETERLSFRGSSRGLTSRAGARREHAATRPEKDKRFDEMLSTSYPHLVNTRR